MSSEKPPNDAGIQLESTASPLTVSDVANVSDAKEDMQLVTTSKDKIDKYLMAGGSISSNFFALMVGCALTVFGSLKSGGVEKEWQPIFWLALYGSLVFALFFGILTARDEWRKFRYRQEIRKLPTTPLR